MKICTTCVSGMVLISFLEDNLYLQSKMSSVIHVKVNSFTKSSKSTQKSLNNNNYNNKYFKTVSTYESFHVE